MSSSILPSSQISSPQRSSSGSRATTSLNTSVRDALKPFRDRVNLLAVGSAILTGVIGACAWAIAVMWADLIVELSGSATLWLARVTWIVPVAVFVIVFRNSVRRADVSQLTRRVDEYCETHGLVEGSWNLTSRGFVENSMTSELAKLAISQSVSTIDSASPAKVVSGKQAVRLFCILAGISLLVACFSVVAPRLTWTQVNRFLFPMVDIPRYSLLTITLDPDSLEVVFGEDCTLAAIAEGEETESMQLIAIRADKSEEIIPMLSEGEGRFSVALSRLREPIEYYAKAKSARSKVGTLTIKTTPEIRGATQTVRFPEYTGVAAKKGPLDQDGISGLIQSEVTIEAASNRPLKRGILELVDKNGSKQQLELHPDPSLDGPLTVEGRFVLDSAGSFELRLEDIDGTMSYDVIAGPIEVSVDQPPSARIVQPRPDSLATPDAALPVAILSEDDFGVSSLELYRSLNDSRPIPETLTLSSGTRQQNELRLPLSQYALQPGDVIKLFARVEDNKPGTPQSFETPITTVKIISREEFQKRLVQQQGMDEMLNRYRQIQRHLENAANAAREAQEAQDALAQDPTNTELQKQAAEKLQAAADAAKQAAQQIEKIAEHPLNMELDQQLSEAMKEIANQLAQNADDLDFLSQEASKQNGELSEGQKEDLDRIASDMNAYKNEVRENVNEPLERMKQTMPLMMAQQAFEDLVQQQSDLAMRMESLRESSDPSDQAAQRRLQSMESQQQTLREQLNELLDRIEEAADRLPPDPELEDLRATAMDFAQAVRNSEASAEMQNAQSEILAQRPRSAAESAARAAEILKSFLRDSEGMGDKACENCKQKFSPGMRQGNSVQDAMNQLMQMMGMKSGQSGMGSGFGVGSSGFGGIGGSQRTPGPSNRGMYGSMPMNSPSSGGQGESGGPTLPNDFLTFPLDAQSDRGSGSSRKGVTSDATNAIPSQYRKSVFQYFQKLAEDQPD